MNRNLLFIALLLTAFLIVGCNGDETKKSDNNEDAVIDLPMLSFDGTDIYYADDITKEEVEILGAFLIDTDFTNGKSKTLIIAKVKDTYQFKMPIEEGSEDDDELLNFMKAYANQISSSVFKGEPVEIHLLNNELELLIVVEMIQGMTLGYNQRIIDGVKFQYDNNIPEADVDSLKVFLKEIEYFNNRITSVTFTLDLDLWPRIDFYVSEELYNDKPFRDEVELRIQEFFDNKIEYERLEMRIWKYASVSYRSYMYKIN